MTKGLFEAQQKALQLLARREHSVQELRYKLLYRNFNATDVDTVIQRCLDQDWLSNQRFAEHYTSVKAKASWGPYYIQHKLQQLGVSKQDVSDALANIPFEEWLFYAEQWLSKRLSPHTDNQSEATKFRRQLQQRGYSQTLIQQVMMHRPKT